MIIVSQTRDAIINFKRINFIKIEADENEYDIEINYGDDNWDVIGTYDNFERAKEVVQEITRLISVTKINATYQEAMVEMEFKKMLRYEMPEK